MKQSILLGIIMFNIIMMPAPVIKAQQSLPVNKVFGDTPGISAFKKNIENKMPGWLKNYQVPGAQVVLLKNWKIVYSGNFGWADKKEGKKVTGSTVFPVAVLLNPAAALFPKK